MSESAIDLFDSLIVRAFKDGITEDILTSLCEIHKSLLPDKGIEHFGEMILPHLRKLDEIAKQEEQEELDEDNVESDDSCPYCENREWTSNN